MRRDAVVAVRRLPRATPFGDAEIRAGLLRHLDRLRRVSRALLWQAEAYPGSGSVAELTLFLPQGRTLRLVVRRAGAAAADAGRLGALRALGHAVADVRVETPRDAVDQVTALLARHGVRAARE